MSHSCFEQWWERMPTILRVVVLVVTVVAGAHGANGPQGYGWE